MEQKEFTNHIHACESKLLIKKCLRVKNRNEMGDMKHCDYCEHMVILELNKNGDKIIGIERWK